MRRPSFTPDTDPHSLRRIRERKRHGERVGPAAAQGIGLSARAAAIDRKAAPSAVGLELILREPRIEVLIGRLAPAVNGE